MFTLPLVFISGMLGSAHCLGMCGPIALALGVPAAGVRKNVLRQIAFSCGRIFTYAALGACGGYGGWKVANLSVGPIPVPALLAVAAGALLIVQGVASLGGWNWSGPAMGSATGSAGPCLGGSLFASLLRMPGWSGVFLAGLFTGALPCGLVYGFLAMAAATGSLWVGMATMIAFGLGTTPLMLGVGCGGLLLSQLSRVKVLRIAACCVVLTGVICLARGVAAWQHVPSQGTSADPYCSRNPLP